MNYAQAPHKRFFERNWKAGFEDKSNIPGLAIRSGALGDNTSELSDRDPWFRQHSNLVQRQTVLDSVKGIIREVTKGV